MKKLDILNEPVKINDIIISSVQGELCIGKFVDFRDEFIILEELDALSLKQKPIQIDKNSDVLIMKNSNIDKIISIFSESKDKDIQKIIDSDSIPEWL